MNSVRLFLIILIAVGGGLMLNMVAAVADYILPPVAEDYTVIPDSWKLTKAEPDTLVGEFNRLAVVHNGKAYEWVIDRFLLADRTNSNTICTGSYMTFTKGYLESLNAKPGATVRVEVVTDKKGGELKVAGIWPVDFKQSWERAIQQGSRVLNLSAEKVRELKSPEAYERKVREFSNQQWELVAKR